MLFDTYPVAGLAVAMAGCAILGVFYWRSVLPHTLKAGLERRFGKLLKRSRCPRPPAATEYNNLASETAGDPRNLMELETIKSELRNYILRELPRPAGRPGFQ